MRFPLKMQYGNGQKFIFAALGRDFQPIPQKEEVPAQPFCADSCPAFLKKSIDNGLPGGYNQNSVVKHRYKTNGKDVPRMPPKPKFTREEIAALALSMIQEGGVSALTARDLGARMGTSARPIFTLFKNMEDVKQAARALAVKQFMAYISDYREYTPAFKRIGMMIVSYGIHEPELFKLLFLQEHSPGVSFRESLRDLEGMDETCVRLVMQDYGLTESEARLLFEQMWIHALGLGTMCAMGVCDFSEEEIGRRQGIEFASLLRFLKSGKLDQVIPFPEKKEANPGFSVGEPPFLPE